MSPDGEWVAGSLFDPPVGSLAVWESDSLVQLGQTRASASTHPLTVLSGACPAVEPCARDCDGDGSVTVDEVLRAANVL
ncbi:MAG: hypothetical protein N3C12_14590 [Candidatus Binatia bacterium]|nr:hypothetical protein [Candidatus Binatia bacterium]